MDRTCRRCKETKPLEDFYEHPSTKHGRDTRCKECSKECAYDLRKQYPDRHRKYDNMRWRTNKKRRQANLNKKGEYRRDPKNKVAIQARGEARRAVASGRIVKALSCVLCGHCSVALEMHHPDYSDPLYVVWVCLPCHRRHHLSPKEYLWNIPTGSHPSTTT